MFAALSDRLSALHRNIEKAIDGLPDEALDWSPGPDMNSIGVLLAHTLGSQRYWIGDIAGQEPSGRVRETEFEVRGLTTVEIRRHMSETLSHSQAVLARLSPDVLDQKRTPTIYGREVTVAFALAHALEHTALHTGHIEITRQLWDQYHG
jgi:uncharacterized damage-inducible protein DinB